MSIDFFGKFFLVAWYPILWIVQFLLIGFAFVEKPMEHDEMSYRALASEGLGRFLASNAVRAFSMASLWLTLIILSSFVSPAVVALVFMLCGFIALLIMIAIGDSFGFL